MADSDPRMLPRNDEAERSVLGSMIRDNNTIDEVVNLVGKEDFYLDAHQKIFAAIVALRNANKPVDLVLLSDCLHDRGQLPDVGSAPYAKVGDLWDAAPTAANAQHYARIVRETALARALIREGTAIVRNAADRIMPAGELLADAERRVFALAEQGVGGQFKALAEPLGAACDRIDRWQARDRTGPVGLSTGFVDLDERICGLQGSELVIIAARPSIGKTALALNLARHLAVDEQQAVLFVSLEQSDVDLSHRLLVAQARVDDRHIRSGCLTRDEIERLTTAQSVLNPATILIADTPHQNMLTIAANARRAKRAHQIAAVFLDYLQLVEPENRRDPRQEQVAGVARRLKALARELGIPVVAMAQLNRTPEDRKDRRPRLADLRESGAIEQDADTVLLLYRLDDEVSRDTDRIGLDIAKQRSGPTGEVTLIFRKPFQRFENHAPEVPYV